MTFRKMLGIFALVILVLGLGLYLAPRSFPTVIPVQASSRSISMIGTYPTWNTSDPTITVTKGDTVTVIVSTSDSISHRLWIDLDNDGLSDQSDCGTNDQCSGFVSSTSSSTIPPFMVNSAGNFTYYCTVHPPPYMTGTFRVQNPPVSDFSLSANPSSLSISQGANMNTTVTVSSHNNFMGTIGLSASSTPPGPTFSFQPNTVAVSPPSATSKLTISIPSTTPTGSYTVTVNGMNSTTTHSTSVSVTVTGPQVPNFSISSNPTTLSVSPGSSVTSSVTLTSQNGFSGTITLTTSVSPSGPQVSIGPSGLTLASGGTATATLTVTASGSGYYSTPTPTGSYTISINATGPSFSRSTTVQLTIGSSSSGGANLPIVLIAGGVVAAIAIIGVAAFLIRRRK